LRPLPGKSTDYPARAGYLLGDAYYGRDKFVNHFEAFLSSAPFGYVFSLSSTFEIWIILTPGKNFINFSNLGLKLLFFHFTSTSNKGIAFDTTKKSISLPSLFFI
jgi:hypothetical protein